MTASDEENATYGFPPRPDKQNDAAAATRCGQGPWPLRRPAGMENSRSLTSTASPRVRPKRHQERLLYRQRPRPSALTTGAASSTPTRSRNTTSIPGFFTILVRFQCASRAAGLQRLGRQHLRRRMGRGGELEWYRWQPESKCLTVRRCLFRAYCNGQDLPAPDYAWIEWWPHSLPDHQGVSNINPGDDFFVETSGQPAPLKATCIYRI